MEAKNDTFGWQAAMRRGIETTTPLENSPFPINLASTNAFFGALGADDFSLCVD